MDLQVVVMEVEEGNKDRSRRPPEGLPHTCLGPLLVWIEIPLHARTEVGEVVLQEAWEIPAQVPLMHKIAFGEEKWYQSFVEEVPAGLTCKLFLPWTFVHLHHLWHL